MERHSKLLQKRKPGSTKAVVSKQTLDNPNDGFSKPQPLE